MNQARPWANGESLSQRIRRAFGDNEYPGNDALEYDMSGDHLECNEVADKLRGKAWQQVEWHRLAMPGDLWFMTPRAVHYYLPTALLSAIEHFEEMDSLLDNLISVLTPRRDNYIIRELRTIVSREEAQCIAGSLEHIVQTHPEEFDKVDLEGISMAIGFWRAQGEAVG